MREEENMRRTMLLATLAVVLMSGVSNAVVLCAKQRSDGTFNSAIKLREECQGREVEVDLAALGLDDDGCPPDSVLVGATCFDKYEGSVWSVPAGAGDLIERIKRGTATLAELTAGGAVQLGVAADDYPCRNDGQDCAQAIFEVSIAGVRPSTHLTWFQAQQACANAKKRLPSNGEWQMAVAGTPDTGGDDEGTTTCNTDNLTGGTVDTGSRSACVSAWGAYDMVGNPLEWTEDWVPFSTACPGWGGASDDLMCLAGASETMDGPGAMIRGGDFVGHSNAGPLAIGAGIRLFTEPTTLIGVRCARNR